MRIAFVGCMVMNREISALIAKSDHLVRAWWLRQGLHCTPDRLRAEVQEAVDAVERERALFERDQENNFGMGFDAICLGYGLCSNGVVGVRARTLPIVVPRCDDCISLFLGSAERYRTLFAEKPGVYWYNAGWMEQGFVPTKENYEAQRAWYAEQYGEENADFLLESKNDWMGKYQHCGFISCPLRDDGPYEACAKQAAADFGWQYFREEGDLTYFDRLINGPWDEDAFLICPPGHRIAADYTGTRKLRAEPIETT